MTSQTLPPRGSTPVARSRRIILGAVVFILNGVQFVALEAIAASAWHHPEYSYTKNFISDLGVTVCGDKPAKSLNAHFTQAGQVLCSPDHSLFNTSFVLFGVLFLLGALLLRPLLSRRNANWQTALAAIFAVCLTTVGLVHAQSQTGGAIIFHVLGAFIGILIGNLFFIRAGIVSRKIGAPRWYSIAAVILGTTGIISGLLVAIPTPLLTPPIFERSAAYSAVLSFLITGGLVLRAQLTRSPARSATGLPDGASPATAAVG